MPRIPSTPSPQKFSEVWSSDFKAAVTKAAGKDGRLSANEARKLAQRPDADRLFADTATRYFELTGKKTVSVDVIAKEMAAYAKRAVEQAAGPDKKLSLKDGEALPADLRDDFFFMRGKPEPKVVAPTPTPAGLPVEAIGAKLTELTANLLMPSETDANFRFVSGGRGSGPITAQEVRQQLAAAHDALIDQVMWVPEELRELSTRTSTQTRDAGQFLQRLIDNADPEDEYMVELAAGFTRLKGWLESNLTDLTVIRFGDVNISTFIVGRAPTGELVGLLTGQVET